MSVVRILLLLFVSFAVTVALILSVPALTIITGRTLRTGRDRADRTIEVEMIQLSPPPRQQQTRQQPARRQLPRPGAPAAPRFAMALGVEGVGGVSVGPTQITRFAGENGSGDGVDQRPEMAGSFDFPLPPAIRAAEQNATLRLMFCVDFSGRPYDIRVTEEVPAGAGLADAGIAALNRTLFKPALRNGQPVAFCGMEQPVEIRFRN